MYRGKYILNKKTAEDVAIGIAKPIKRFYLWVCIISVAVLVGINIYRALGMNAETSLVTFGIVSFASAIIILLCVSTIKKSSYKVARTLLDQLDTSYHTEELIKDLFFEEEKINITDSENSKEFWYSSIIKMTETDKHILFKLKGNLYLWVEKNSIEGGTVDEFKSFMNGKIIKK